MPYILRHSRMRCSSNPGLVFAYLGRCRISPSSYCSGSWIRGRLVIKSSRCGLNPPRMTCLGLTWTQKITNSSNILYSVRTISNSFLMRNSPHKCGEFSIMDTNNFCNKTVRLTTYRWLMRSQYWIGSLFMVGSLNRALRGITPNRRTLLMYW